MFKLLIVDDEIIIREGIQKTISWREYGIEVIGTAPNGVVALEMVKNDSPDIVITDISMPEKNGIELIHDIKLFNKDISAIILTGYDEFEYAQRAIELNVCHYVLKPVDPSILLDKVCAIKEEKEIQIKNAQEYQLLKDRFHHDLPIIRERFLQNALEGKIDYDDDIEDTMHLLGIGQNKSSFLVSVICIDNFQEIYGNMDKDKKYIDSFKITSIITNNIPQEFEIHCIQPTPSTYAIIFELEDDVETFVLDYLSEVRRKINQTVNLTITIGIGNFCTSFNDIGQCYDEACEALQYKVFLGKNQIISINDVLPTGKSIVSYPAKEQSALVTAIKVYDKALGLKSIENIFQALHQNKNLPLLYIQKICIELLIITSRTLDEIGINPSTIIGEEVELWKKILFKETLMDLQEFLTDIFTSIFDLFDNQKGIKNRKITEEIKKYITDHYSEKINLSHLAEKFFLSYSYLSLLFKKETGYSLTDYMCMLRVEKAKELLEDPTVKVYEIGYKVGIEDSHYFTRMFKKYTHLSPTQFRDMLFKKN